MTSNPSLRQRRDLLAIEGEAAFAAGLPVTGCPHPEDSFERQSWLGGWWKAHYAQRDADRQAISLWVYQNVQCVGSLRLAESLAMMIQQGKDYDRLKPIPGNKLGGELFDIPAPAELSRDQRVRVTDW